MRNAGLDEPQAGIKIAGRNINNLRDADDTTFMAESEEELKSLLMKVAVVVIDSSCAIVVRFSYLVPTIIMENCSIFEGCSVTVKMWQEWQD